MSDALAGLRVLDLSDASGQYCGKMFSDLGAEVILVEPPGGSPVRRQPPCFEGTDGADHSLAFAYFNAGKKGVCIDLKTREGQQRFRQLAQRFQHRRHRRGIGPSIKCQRHPRLIIRAALHQ